MSVRVRPLALARPSCHDFSVTTDDGPEAPSSLANHLLCAVPQLVDPNFVRSVVLMVDHSVHGAFGLVLSNVLPTRVREFADALQLQWTGPDEQRIRLGGPVEPQRAFLLHDDPTWDPLAEQLAPGLFLTASLEGVRRENHERFGGGERSYMVVLGYAGWGAGQLEYEMSQGSWMAAPLRAEPGDEGLEIPWIWDTPPDQMWQQALASIGIDPARLIGGALGGGRIAQA